jgi:myosin heavy subunit
MSWFVPETGTEDKVYIRDAEYAWLPATVVPASVNEDDGESSNNNKEDDNTNNKQDNSRVQVRIELPSDWESTTVCHSSNQNNKQTTSESIATFPHEETRWVSLKDYPKHQLLLQNQGVVARDMAELPHLHEAAILYQVKERHLREKPYTRVGEIVVAINPCQWITGLYTKEQQEKYAQILVWQEGTSLHCCIEFYGVE